MLSEAIEIIGWTLSFYHPAVWWVSYCIRLEREHCCDDLATNVCGDRLSYAKELVAMEQLRMPSLGLVMSARGRSLLSRVTRLIGPSDEQRRPVGGIAGLIALVTLTFASAFGAGLLTPPDKPTEGIPEEKDGDLKSQISNLKSETSHPKSGVADPNKDGGQFIGRVRLKTEKALPDLEKVKLLPGKVLDESLVFSKEGGLANVFVYLRKPTFKIEEPADVAGPKPFILIAEDGKFWPHVALVRVGRPVVFENRLGEPVNFHTQSVRNDSHNVLVPSRDHRKLPAFTKVETTPFAVKSDIHPWMQSQLLTLDHPFADVTDEEGRFTINGLPPGQHEFRVWHERVGWLEKSLVVTIKPGEESRSDLEYEPNRLKLEEAEVQNWSNRLIDTRRVPGPLIPRRVAPQPEDKAKGESSRESSDGDPKAQISNLKSEISNPKTDAVKTAIERAIAFLKAQQQDEGTWQGTPADGVTALSAAALLQAGVKANDPAMLKALAHLRKIEPSQIYVVALQTMVFCAASPKEDAELIRRNVAWIEKAQVPDGKSRGAWSYVLAHGGRGDGSCLRFAVLGLHAAKKAGFEVQAETWQRVSGYWLTTQKDQGGWGYTPEAGTTPTMTLAGVAGLATANRYLPQDDQAKVREAAIRKPADYLEKMIPELQRASFAFYALHCLERAGHVSGLTQFGKLEWKTDTTKRLVESQHPNGSWKGGTAPTAENELVATSLALLALTGQPEPKLVVRRLRIEPRDAGGKMQVRTNLIENSTPPRQRTEISGGVRIESIEQDGSKWRIEADRAIIESGTGVNAKLELTFDSDVTRIECIGSVILEGGRDDGSTRLKADNIDLDLRENSGFFNSIRGRP